MAVGCSLGVWVWQSVWVCCSSPWHPNISLLPPNTHIHTHPARLPATRLPARRHVAAHPAHRHRAQPVPPTARGAAGGGQGERRHSPHPHPVTPPCVPAPCMPPPCVPPPCASTPAASVTASHHPAAPPRTTDTTPTLCPRGLRVCARVWPQAACGGCRVRPGPSQWLEVLDRLDPVVLVRGGCAVQGGGGPLCL